MVTYVDVIAITMLILPQTLLCSLCYFVSIITTTSMPRLATGMPHVKYLLSTYVYIYIS